MKITRDEYQDWVSNPITQAYLALMEKDKQTCLNNLTQASLMAYSLEQIALRQLAFSNRLQMLNYYSDESQVAEMLEVSNER